MALGRGMPITCQFSIQLLFLMEHADLYVHVQLYKKSRTRSWINDQTTPYLSLVRVDKNDVLNFSGPKFRIFGKNLGNIVGVFEDLIKCLPSHITQGNLFRLCVPL
jgi:hypothetical protein